MSVVLEGDLNSSVLSCDGHTLVTALKPTGTAGFDVLGGFCFRLSAVLEGSVSCKTAHVWRTYPYGWMQSVNVFLHRNDLSPRKVKSQETGIARAFQGRLTCTVGSF